MDIYLEVTKAIPLDAVVVCNTCKIVCKIQIKKKFRHSALLLVNNYQAISCPNFQIVRELLYQGRYIKRTTISIFSFCIGLVTQLNGSTLGVLKHHYITKRIRELLIGNSILLIYKSLNQLLY